MTQTQLVERLHSSTRTLSATVLLVTGALLCYSVVLLLGNGSAQAGPAAYRPLDQASVPVRLVVPALKLRSKVVPIAMSSDAVLAPPEDYREVGWWDDSAKVGAHRGQTVITGHTVHTGGGAMDHLGEVRRGQQVQVVTPYGRMHYRVTGVRELSKDALARQAVSLFGQDSREGRLVLVSCTDWNGSYFARNVIVFAAPLGVRAPSVSAHGPLPSRGSDAPRRP
jgi:LPXTG-site transpeptidase (sortase) family protein